MRCILAMKSGSLEAFHVVVAFQETLPARRIRRRVSRLMATVTFCLTRWSASLLRLQVENAVIFQSAGTSGR